MEKKKKTLNLLAVLSPMVGGGSWGLMNLFGTLAGLFLKKDFSLSTPIFWLTLGIDYMILIGSIVMGIISLIQITRSHGEQSGRVFAFIGIIFSGLLLAVSMLAIISWILSLLQPLIPTLP